MERIKKLTCFDAAIQDVWREKNPEAVVQVKELTSFYGIIMDVWRG